MSLSNIKVSRGKALDIVRENKEKHDQLLKEAIEGYWIEADQLLKKHEKDSLALIEKLHRETLKSLRKTRKENIKNLKNQVKKELDLVSKREKTGYTIMHKSFPADHGDDYMGTIRRLELCIDPDIELNTNEFDAYIRNKWQWREQFLATNLNYAKTLYSSEVGGLYGEGRYGYAISASYATGSIASSSYSSLFGGVSSKIRADNVMSGSIDF